jgi:hypothetical protein
MVIIPNGVCQHWQNRDGLAVPFEAPCSAQPINLFCPWDLNYIGYSVCVYSVCVQRPNPTRPDLT